MITSDTTLKQIGKLQSMTCFLLLFVIIGMGMVAGYETSATITDTQIGQIRSDFYGVNQPYTISTKYNVSEDLNSCSRNITTNYTLTRQLLNESKIINLRLDGGFDSINETMYVQISTITQTNQELIPYACQNNLTYTLIANYMPNWLANKTNGWCTLTGSNNTCSPTNYTKWGEVVLAGINNYTQNGLYANCLQIEVWNEPWGGYWLNNLSTDNIIKSVEYNKLYNATYIAIKSQYPNMKVLGLGGDDSSTLSGSSLEISSTNITKNWFSNFSNADGYTIHYYFGSITASQSATRVSYAVNKHKDFCNILGRTYCNNIYITEYNTYGLATQALNDIQKMNIGAFYSETLALNISGVIFFKWETPYRNFSCESTANYTAIRQKDLYPAYNITKLFAQNHKAGNTVLTSSTSRADLKIVASKDSSKTYITITNTNSTGVNVTVTDTNLIGQRLTDVETGVNYTSSTGVYNLGQLTGYQVKTLVSNPNVVNINWNQATGQIRSDFYGVNTHGRFLTNASFIDVNKDGTVETQGNRTWNREVFSQSGMNYIRVDAYLDWNANEDRTFDEVQGSKYNNALLAKESVEYMNQTGGKVIFIISNMPRWLNDSTRGLCTPAEYYTCPPYNYTRWGLLVTDFLNYTTNGGKWIGNVELSLWNEPYGSSWLNNISGNDNITKAIEYTKLYNATYKAVKSVYPNVPVGGPSGYRNMNNLMYHFLDNASYYNYGIDFIGLHPYSSQRDHYYLTDQHLIDISYLLSNCTKYEVNCGRIVFEEWGSQNYTLKNMSSLSKEHALNTAYVYSTLLNLYPNNISLLIYQWSEVVNYSSIYPEYPHKWGIVSEPQLDNYVSSVYNITKLFAHYMPSSASVKNSSSNYSAIKVVASSINGYENLILTNTESNNNSLDLVMTGSGASVLIDVNSKELYTVSSGVVQDVNLDNYEVKVLTEPIVCTYQNQYAWCNYLIEPIRTMTNDEYDNYLRITRTGLGNPDNAFNSSYIFIIGGGGGLISLALMAGIFYMYYNGKIPFKTFIKVIMISVIMLLIAGTILLI